jgi:hypothetical protein
LNTTNGLISLIDCGAFETTIIDPSNGLRTVITCCPQFREIVEVQIGYELYYLLDDYQVWQDQKWIEVRNVRGKIMSYYNKWVDYKIIRKYIGKICVPSCYNWIDKTILIGKK